MHPVTRTVIALLPAVYARTAAAECTTYQNDLDACRILDIWSAEVDHIIPRKDSHGCPCGHNGYANAQVISKSLNSSLQNSCVDERRIEILKAYTNFNTVYPNGLPGIP